MLVACGTKNGTTAQIAESIAEVLRKNGMRADAVSARSMTRVEPYDAVVVGGGLYAGRRHMDAVTRRHLSSPCAEGPCDEWRQRMVRVLERCARLTGNERLRRIEA
ncbi:MULTISPECIES: flavodoxin domain-containing protein [unclassified Streptomyces]|uniref:flavodoxin domain-containing protein n=1 Tax=unclassified Streptomyces TaxID=2593676 RepID=UPI002E271F0C|nr:MULTISPECIES: flavodoxin domain-containing protein [unclassified Streptomyces]